jgi:hypothetical protein
MINGIANAIVSGIANATVNNIVIDTDTIYNRSDVFALWHFENNLLDETDNDCDLEPTVSAPTYDSSTQIADDYSLACDRSSQQSAYIENGDLILDFPMTGSVTAFTIAGRFRTDTAGVAQYLVSKYTTVGDQRGLGLQFDEFNTLKALHGETGGANYEIGNGITGLSANVNYAFCYSEDDGSADEDQTGNYVLRVYNVDSGSLVGTATGTWSNAFNTNSADFHIGGRDGSSSSWDGVIDDILLANTVWDADTMDSYLQYLDEEEEPATIGSNLLFSTEFDGSVVLSGWGGLNADAYKTISGVGSSGDDVFDDFPGTVINNIRTGWDSDFSSDDIDDVHAIDIETVDGFTALHFANWKYHYYSGHQSSRCVASSHQTSAQFDEFYWEVDLKVGLIFYNALLNDSGYFMMAETFENCHISPQVYGDGTNSPRLRVSVAMEGVVNYSAWSAVIGTLSSVSGDRFTVTSAVGVGDVDSGWNRIGYYFKRGSTDGIVKMFLNGVLVLHGVGDTQGNYSQVSDFNFFKLYGSPFTNQEVWFKDLNSMRLFNNG